ncbi:YbhN family protein, partial [Patescibacteria group bacterium]|nr:YbhN family protein [Patescibacteria group bacterium]
AVDLLALALFALGSLFFVAGNLTQSQLVERAAIAGGMAVAALFLFVVFGGRYISKIFGWVVRLFHIGAFSFIRAFSQKIDEAGEMLARGRKRHILFPLLAFSMVFWAIDFLSNWLLLRGSGISIGFFTATVAFSLPIVASILPVQPLGGFGLFEGSLALGLFLFGFPKDASLAAGLIVHIEMFLFSFFLACIGYAYLLRKSFFKHTT